MRIHPGAVLDGRYTVEDVIGRGGAGVVIAARHRTRRKRVALKLLRSDRPRDAQAVGNLIREGRITRRIESAHVRRALETVLLPCGEPFLVLEHLKGSDLAALLAARGPLPVAEAKSYVRQACAGLAVAHALGIVHGDLKPSNLFVTRRADGAAVVKIIDFGIAKWISSRSRGHDQGPNDDVMGSPPFVAPEQLRGAAADPRSDIWALGAILLTLLAGRSPFERRSLSETYFAILSGSIEDLTTMRADVPRAVSAVVERCLSVDVERRYQSVEELEKELRS